MKLQLEVESVHRRKRAVGGVLLLTTLALYWPVLAYDFVNFDDPGYVINNSHVNTGFHWSQAPWFFQAGYKDNWHPLTWVSHALDCQLYGLWAGGHHLTNVILHSLSAAALFLLLQRFTKAFWRSALVAALFAWHPLRVESVAWISERKDCLACLLWILTLWAYLRYADNLKSQISNFKFYYGLALVFFVLALMSKPMVVTLPFVLLLLDFWPLGRGKACAPLALVKEKIPFFLLSIAGCVVTLVAQSRSGAMGSLAQVPLALRFSNAAASYLWYVEKTLWPQGLMAIYPLTRLPGWLIATAITVVALISGLAWRWRRKRPFFLWGWCWYLGTLVPVVGLVQAGSQAVADRYSYIPSIGLLIMIVWGLNDLAARWPYHRVVLGVLASVALVASAAATRVQLSYWRDGGTLFARALSLMPDNPMALDGHVAYLREHGRLEEARIECEKSLRIFPDNGLAHYNLAQVLLAGNKLDLAVDQFRLAKRCLPDRVGPPLELGEILLAQNRPREAAVEFQDALKLDPNGELVHSRLAKALARQGSVQDAVKEFAECIRLKPDDAEPHALLAGLLAGQGRTAEAISHYQQSLRLQPNSAETLNNLAWILATDPHADLRDGPEAVRLASRACELTHDKMPLVVGTLAAAYAEAARFDEAAATAQKAHDLALAAGNQQVAEKNLELLKLYISRHPFHQNP